MKIIRNSRFCMNDGWCFYFDYYRFMKKFHSATSAEIRVFSYDKSKSGNSLVTDILGDALSVKGMISELGDSYQLNVTESCPTDTFSTFIEKCFILKFLWSNFSMRKKYRITIN
jgi:hypothetical protein